MKSLQTPPLTDAKWWQKLTAKNEVTVCRFLMWVLPEFYEELNMAEIFLGSLWSALDTTLCDKACQGLAAGQWFSPSIKVTATI
jgi:hypothetical protein